ncbi:hypothetical protein Rsub_02318 [Raphidocelis subcapitata]|uniref:CCHC-type domain-containing protein n=1 Tax=Raphidocelis subcapitata TaxID=307507 RepID=A0A2V0NVK4_9CHLO|nr:hypothetical protein Rsub_02318 [Raphidocelis subcapitata]|eukprot:GBF89600.1 hypothetical protein Rsub_02318 [Raphidocelis subcapitata]
MEELLQACDRAWPRGGDPVAAALNDLARNLLVGGEHVDPKLVFRSKNARGITLGRTGMVLHSFRQSASRAVRAALSKLKIWELLEADPAGCFRVEGDYSDFSSRVILDLAALRRAAAGARDAPRAGGEGVGGGRGAADCPLPCVVAVAASGMLRPSKWLTQLESTAEGGSGLPAAGALCRVCTRCGFRGHAAAGCSLSYCDRCRLFGHGASECATACARCGISGGEARRNPERAARNQHGARQCPFSACGNCRTVGHRTEECAFAPAASAGGAGGAGGAQSGPSTPQASRAPPPPRGSGGGSSGDGADPDGAPRTADQISHQVEALVDLMLDHCAETAVELVGSAGARLLTTALGNGGRAAYEAVEALVRAGDGAAALDAIRAAAAAAAPRPSGSLPGGAAPNARPAAAASAAPLSAEAAAQLVELCDAVWPPDAAPHPLLKGELAKLLLQRAGGGAQEAGGVEGGWCWMPIAVAGPRLLAFWRSEQQLFPAGPDAPPPFSSVAAMLSGDPYVSCRTRTGSGEACVVLDAAKLSRWGASAPLPSFSELLCRIDDAWDPTGGDAGASEAASEAATLVNWLAKALAAAGNPGAAAWGPSAAARASANDWGYCLAGPTCGTLLRQMWRANPATWGRPFPSHHSLASLLALEPLFRSHQCPRNRSVRRWRLDLYALVGCRRPAPGD